MSSRQKDAHFKQERTRVYTSERDDPYRTGYRESALCTECGALYRNGRWTWEDIPKTTFDAICPACRRIGENHPAGILELGGDFYLSHRREIQNLIRNTERLEMGHHPLERIMRIERAGDGDIVTTTGVHLARRIGDALHSAYEGSLEYRYGSEPLIRLRWKR